MTTELDRFYLQTRPDGASDYAIWLRHSYDVAGETRYELEGPLTPDQADVRGFPLAGIMDQAASAAILAESLARTALTALAAEIEARDDRIAELETALAQLQAADG